MRIPGSADAAFRAASFGARLTTMKRLIALLFLLSVSASAADAQDLDKGREAFERRDYAAAFVQFLPLAKRGVAEAQFFIGAMYISYVFIVGIIITTAVILSNFFGNPDTWVYMAVVISTTVGFLPIIYRLSRVLFLYWFGGVEYDESA